MQFFILPYAWKGDQGDDVCNHNGNNGNDTSVNVITGWVTSYGIQEVDLEETMLLQKRLKIKKDKNSNTNLNRCKRRPCEMQGGKNNDNGKNASIAEA